LYQDTIDGGGTKDPSPKRDAWKELRKERKKFSKLLIFSTDCSQSMGLQSVIKIRGKTSKFFAVLPLVFITDCSPIDWQQSLLTIRSFENFFIYFLNFFQASRFFLGDGSFDPPLPPCIVFWYKQYL
jgi:hypothetical protein